MSISTTSGCSFSHGVQRLAAVGGVADDFDLGLVLEQHAERLAQDRVVIDDQDLDAAGVLSRCGCVRHRVVFLPESLRALASRAGRVACCFLATPKGIPLRVSYDY